MPSVPLVTSCTVSIDRLLVVTVVAVPLPSVVLPSCDHAMLGCGSPSNPQDTLAAVFGCSFSRVLFSGVIVGASVEGKKGSHCLVKGRKGCKWGGGYHCTLSL